MRAFKLSLLILVSLFLNSCEGPSMSDLEDLPEGAKGGASTVPPKSGAASLSGTGQEIALFMLPPIGADDMLAVAFGAACAAPTGLGSSGGGPIVGILNFGGGSGQNQRVEFDLPVAMPNFSPGVGNGAIIGAGAIVVVPASTLTALARNDANLLPPKGTGALGSAAAPAVTVTAHVTRGTGFPSKLFRTVWMSHDGGGGGVGPGVSTFAAVPAFARSVRIIRTSTALPISVQIQGAGGLSIIDGPYAIAPGAQSPTFDLSGQAVSVIITNTDGALTLGTLAAVFEISI